MRRNQPQVAGHARRADADQGPQRRQHSPGERLAISSHGVPARSAREQVLPVTPEAEMHMAAVPYAATDARRRERGLQTLPQRHRPDGLPDQHAVVGGAYRVTRPDRDLELASRVFGVELLDPNALLLDRLHNLAGVIRKLDDSRHLIRRPLAG